MYVHWPEVTVSLKVLFNIINYNYFNIELKTKTKKCILSDDIIKFSDARKTLSNFKSLLLGLIYLFD